MGRMDIACSDCGALHWASEKLVNSPKFGMCCNSGKIKVPRLDDPPPELLHLLSGQEDICKKFCDYIRNYNNALAMTSLGCNQDTEINRDGVGLLCSEFKVAFITGLDLSFLSLNHLLYMLNSTFMIHRKHWNFA